MRSLSLRPHTVLGIERVVVSGSESGEFYWPLAPGVYQAKVAKEGYRTLLANITVPKDGTGSQQHFVLQRLHASSKRKREGGGADAVMLVQQAAPRHTRLGSALVLLLIGAAVLHGCAEAATRHCVHALANQ